LKGKEVKKQGREWTRIIPEPVKKKTEKFGISPGSSKNQLRKKKLIKKGKGPLANEA